MEDFYIAEENRDWGYHGFQICPNYYYDSDDSDFEFDWTSFKLQTKVDWSYETDEKNRRIIRRESMFQDPDAFRFISSYIHRQNNVQNRTRDIHNDEEMPMQQSKFKYDPGFDWTKINWQKAGIAGNALSLKQINKQSRRKMKPMKPNAMLKFLAAGLLKPVKITYAENIMQKMGWQGGALGKSGDGIVEPIAPFGNFFNSRCGFGQESGSLNLAQQTKQKRKQKKPKNLMKLKGKAQKAIYKTNALYHILDFVRNDYEVEIKFDSALRPLERKYIHSIVNDSINCSGENVIDMDFDNMVQMEILEEIKKCNIFILRTQSEGQPPKRSLCLFKDAPEHMYLVTPTDLREDEESDEECDETVDLTEEVDETKTEKECHVKEMDIEIKCSQNNAASNNKNNDKSTDEVTKNFKDYCRIYDNTIDPGILKKLVEYFVEFVETESYMEFRFLGTYNNDEIDTINYFLRNYLVLVKVLLHKKNIFENLERSGYYLQCMEDDNRSILFLKLPHNGTD